MDVFCKLTIQNVDFLFSPIISGKQAAGVTVNDEPKTKQQSDNFAFASAGSHA